VTLDVLESKWKLNPEGKGEEDEREETGQNDAGNE